MPLIDHTFFTGEIKIPNTDKPDVLEELTEFITKYEEKFLTDVLGYNLYKAFRYGLAENPMQPRWAALLAGTEYTYNNTTKKFKGIIEDAVVSGSLLLGYKQPVLIKFGTTPYPSNVATVTLDGTGGKPDWRGWEILPEKMGFGTLKKGIDYNYNKVTGKWDLLSGATFEQDEYYFIQFLINEPSITISGTKKSPIANFVYYWWSRNNMSETTGIGEQKSKPENATDVSPAKKQAKAWNEMSEQVSNLRQFIFESTYDYSLFDSSLHTGNYSYYRPINAMF